MNENPYTPPNAEVKDAASDRAVPERPRQVVHAVRMLWLSLVLSIPLSMREFQDASAESDSTFLLYFILTLYAISVVINIHVHRGSNWARILLLVFNVLNVLSFAAAMNEILKYPAGDLVALGASMFLDLVALVLLYTRPGALWFRRIPR
jgi:hypothetical protein